MTPAEQKSRLTVEEYLDFETRSFEIKHEYLAGEIWAMVGGTDRHNLVALNLASILKRHLRGTPCRTFMADMKLRIDEADAFFYPDVFVTCDRRDLGERLFKRHARFVAKVVSPATECFDRGRKFQLHRLSAALQEYWLIDPERLCVDTYRRMGEDWLLHTYGEGDRAIPLPCLELTVDMAELYEDVF
ncbi:MAG TPA: Uma2 family endonuclease [Sedimenticola sp.]|nr:Uma2 family endonuclease [Sedimenticola sp.]